MLALSRHAASLVAALALATLTACGGGDIGDPSAASEPTAGGGGNAAASGLGGAAGSSWASGPAGAGGMAGAAGQASGGAGGAAGAEGAAGAAGADPGSGGSGGTSSVPASCPRIRVSVPAGQVLNVRPSPSTSGTPVGTLGDGAIADVLAFVKGELLDGSDLWYQIKAGTLSGYVWSGLALCTTDEPPTTKPGFYLPLECGKSAKVTQGNFGSYSHQGFSAYAFDFGLSVGTPMTAMDDGTVSYVYDQTGPGDPCYNGGNSSCIDKANVVVLLHADGTKTQYAHLSKVLVAKGQKVKRGTKVGLSGSTGYSTGPHAHVSRMKGCTSAICQSIAMKFQDVAGDGVPNTGETVKSGNCP